MSVSQRTHRVRIFAYSDTGVDGRPNETYTYAAERWASVSVLQADEETVATQAQHTTVALFGFADEVTVTRNGLLKWDGRYWEVDSAEPRKIPSRREIQVTAFWIDDANITGSIVGEPA